MSHFTVLVIGEGAEAMLAPFQENNMGDAPKQYLRFKAYPKDGNDGQWFDSEEHAKDSLGEQFDPEEGHYENPNAKWDWFSLGGRWSNFFTLKNGEKADQVRVRDIDFDTKRNEWEAKAGELYDKVTAIIAGRPIPIWNVIREKHATNIDAAREEYNKNPVAVDLRKSRLLDVFDDPEEFTVTREQYLARARNQAHATHAFIKDGEWVEKGRMGWFAVVTNEMDKDNWHFQFNEMLSTLPGHTLISLYDCHI